MSVIEWQTIKTCFCDRVHAEVGLEAQVVYPAENLPDQPPRILAHRCSRSCECNMESRPSCKWAGTNPFYDPFAV
ncbi:MAG: hypothetical protein EHM41_06485 [Chloroflexi bacterium]|nr:MAG: hypothetical protein EHM41_06485 [Chloroflexota bacterium]